MIVVKNMEGKYLTRKSLAADFSFTCNKNIAYVFDSIAQAQELIERLDEKAIIGEE